MPETLPIDTPRPEWIAYRRTRVGSSDIGSIAGLTPFPGSSIIDVWRRKRSGEQIPDNVYMRRGREQEPHVADEFADATGLTPVVTGTWAHPDNPRHIASPDRLIGDDSGLEIKVTSERYLDRWIGTQDDLPPYYVAQVQWCMYVTGRPTWWLAARIHGHDVITHRIERDDDLIAHYADIADRFLADLDAGTVPRTPWRPVDVAAINAAFPGDPDATAVTAPSATVALVNRRAKLDDEISVLVAERDGVTARIKAAMGDAPELVDPDGTTLATWRPHRRTSVNMSRLRADHPDLVEKYIEEGTSRPFLLR